MAAQRATDLRRVLADVEANAKELREQKLQIEAQLVAMPSASWPEAAAKARYVLTLYAATLGDADSQHRKLIEAVLDDFVRLSSET